MDRTRAILAGQRTILLHVVEIDRDLSLPFDGEVGVSDGTKPDARFVLDPVGVDFMIKSLNPEIAHRPCLGVKIDEEGYASLVGTECNPGGATLFGVSREGKDDKGRLSYAIVSEKYGVVQWSPSQKKIYVEVLGAPGGHHVQPGRPGRGRSARIRPGQRGVAERSVGAGRDRDAGAVRGRPHPGALMNVDVA